MAQNVATFMENVVAKNPAQPEFHQAVQEVVPPDHEVEPACPRRDHRLRIRRCAAFRDREHASAIESLQAAAVNAHLERYGVKALARPNPDQAHRRGVKSTMTLPQGNLALEGSVIKSTAIDPSVVDADDVYQARGAARERAARLLCRSGSLSRDTPSRRRIPMHRRSTLLALPVLILLFGI